MIASGKNRANRQRKDPLRDAGQQADSGAGGFSLPSLANADITIGRFALN
jgi:hypothetical protein